MINKENGEILGMLIGIALTFCAGAIMFGLFAKIAYSTFTFLGG